MRAALLRGPGDLVIEERPVPRAGPGHRRLCGYANTWPTAISLVASGKVDVNRLVTGAYPLDQAEEALTAGRRDQRSVKTVIRAQT